jgi:hypothetical protein
LTLLVSVCSEHLSPAQALCRKQEVENRNTMKVVTMGGEGAAVSWRQRTLTCPERCHNTVQPRQTQGRLGLIACSLLLVGVVVLCVFAAARPEILLEAMDCTAAISKFGKLAPKH